MISALPLLLLVLHNQRPRQSFCHNCTRSTHYRSSTLGSCCCRQARSLVDKGHVWLCGDSNSQIRASPLECSDFFSEEKLDTTASYATEVQTYVITPAITCHLTFILLPMICLSNKNISELTALKIAKFLHKKCRRNNTPSVAWRPKKESIEVNVNPEGQYLWAFKKKFLPDGDEFTVAAPTSGMICEEDSSSPHFWSFVAYL
uniref:Uncharacterized protein n=1 Tax=Glossina pallidipes TaxID=7398 RepID=A0A1A9Z755_GLOPL